MQLMGLGLGFGVRGLGLKACGFRSYRVFRAWQKGNPSKWNFPNSEKNAYLGIYKSRSHTKPWLTSEPLLNVKLWFT